MAEYERAQTVEAPAGALFEFLAEVGNLPSYFEQMTAAEGPTTTTGGWT